ncbi:MAG: T9SS type A sorting domain-containing protein [Chitinophagales bacterium]|nr:T9SS type A sorting domain-containing protein [Chitinophagales bacterium]MDW8427491.1 T9SS type A sorting domain-containing protein [Chitinophagales bacterium]
MTKIFRFMCAAIISLFVFSNFLFGQTIQWAKTYGGSKKDKGRDVAVDAQGNIYLAGFFTEQMTLGNITLNSVGPVSKEDIFVAKLDPNGEPIWAHNFGNGIENHSDFPLAFHGNKAGYTAVTGDFKNNLLFDDGTFLNGIGGFDMFLAVYDTDGNLLWAKVGGGSGNDIGTGVFVSDDNYIYCTGNFKGDCNFFGDSTLVWGVPPQHYVYVAKYDLAGNLIWLNVYGSETNFESRCIVYDQKTFVYVGGNFRNAITLSNANLTATGEEDGWLAQFGVNGNFQWAKSFGSSNPLSNECIYSIACDTNQNFYISSIFSQDINFDGNVLSTGSEQNVCVAAYDKMGTYKWSKAVSGTPGALFSAHCLGLLAEGNILLTGCFAGEVVVDNSITLIPNGPNPIYADAFYVGLFPKTGNIAFAVHVGGELSDAGHGLAGNYSGYAFACGHYKNAGVFGNFSLVSNGNTDAFLIKFAQNFVSVGHEFSGFSTSIFPNPAHETVTIAIPSEVAELFVSDMSGRIVLHQNVSGLSTVKIPLAQFAPGTYLVSLNGGSANYKAKLLVQH